MLRWSFAAAASLVEASTEQPDTICYQVVAGASHAKLCEQGFARGLQVLHGPELACSFSLRGLELWWRSSVGWNQSRILLEDQKHNPGRRSMMQAMSTLDSHSHQ
ncbi:unnamed protein product [Durusdinium trenchii]|uniref:Secreted protein n=1 Tax=Durusdinium trenchii TaxID=1381693 RepID=A0ABP0RPX9_9DINO